MSKPSLTESLKAAKEWLATFNPGDEIDEESGFNADQLRVIIEFFNAVEVTEG